jgi:uncharacterized protein
MQLNVAQLLKSSIGTERNYRIDEDIEIESRKVRVVGEVKLIRTDRSILIKSALVAKIDIECVRCLEIFQCPIEIKFEEEFFPTIEVLTGLPYEVPEEQQPGYFIIDENHIIDLDEAIRQYTILGIPMKPLCKEECAGLCPTCGKNINQGCCNCLIET